MMDEFPTASTSSRNQPSPPSRGRGKPRGSRGKGRTTQSGRGEPKSSPLGNVAGGLSPAPEDPQSRSANSTPVNRKLFVPEDPRSRSANSTPVNRKLFVHQNADTAENDKESPGDQMESDDKTSDGVLAGSPSLQIQERSMRQQSTTPLTRSAASDPGVFQHTPNPVDELAGKRPKCLRKEKSEPALTETRLTIDGKIREKLTIPMTKKQVDEKKAGNNYIFRAVFERDKEVLKIGRTKRSVSTRRATIQSTCRPVDIKPLDDLDLVPMELFEKVEELIHAELVHFRYNFTCKCLTTHREYFDVPVERARRSSRRWKSFCRRKPYDDGGQLKGFWLQRLRQEPPKDPSSECDPRSDDEWIERRWEWYTNPTRVEIVCYHSAIIADHIKATIRCVLRYRWQVIAMVNGLLLTLASFPSLIALIWFATVAFSAFFERHAEPADKTTAKTGKGQRASGSIQQGHEKCVLNEEGGNDVVSESQAATDDRQTSLGADEDAEMPDAETEFGDTTVEIERKDNQDEPIIDDVRPTGSEEVGIVGCGVLEDGEAAAAADGADVKILERERWVDI